MTDYEAQIKRWQEESHPSVPAVVTLSSAGWYGGGTNIWWRIRYGDEDRKLQACVLRDVTLIGSQVHGCTTVLSPTDSMFSSKGAHWDYTYEAVQKRGGWFLKYQGDQINGGLYAIFTHVGVDIVRPALTTTQTDLSYDQG